MESYSQIGQDIWVREVLKNKMNGYFLDIGAHDGIYLSNTYVLEKNFNWKGICIDANPAIIDRLKANRGNSVCLNKLLDSKKTDQYFLIVDQNDQSGVFSKVLTHEEYRQAQQNKDLNIKTMETSLIKDILKEHNAPKIIDYMSVDIEGKEIEFLNSFPFDQYQVQCLTVEHNEPHEGSYRRNMIRHILSNHGYKFVKGNDDIKNWGHGPIDDYYVFSQELKDQIKKKDFSTPKIGILIKKFDSLFTCGISQQSHFTYKVLKNAGFNVEFITADDNYTQFEFTNIPIRKLDYNKDLSDLSLMLFVSSSITTKKDLDFIRSFNIKIVNQVCGNYYYIQQEDIVHDCHKRDFFSNSDLVDEFWILPMYDHMKSFIEVMTKKPVYVMNYVWDEEIIELYMKVTKKNAFCDPSLKYKDNLHLLIAEPNLSVHKTCLVPMCIAEDYENIHKNISRVYLMCKNKHQSFNLFLSHLNITKKTEQHFRIVLLEVLSQLRDKKIPIVLLSHQIKNELNFLHLELMYLGYPIIHNCDKLYNIDPYNNYYYSEHNIHDGRKQLEKLNLEYDSTKIDYKKILEKFNPKNKDNINYYRKAIYRVLGEDDIQDSIIIKNKQPKMIKLLDSINSHEIIKPQKVIKSNDTKKSNLNQLDSAIDEYLNDSIDSLEELEKKNVINNNDKSKDVFTHIYNQSSKPSFQWNNDGETVSGPGSTIENTAYTRFEIKNIIRKFNIKSILDIGCGDFNWMKIVLSKNEKHINKYLGVDVVESLINQNIENFKNDIVDFKKVDLCQTIDNIEKNHYDLVICKEVMIHLSIENSLNLIKNFKKLGAKYLLATTFLKTENINIQDGHVYNINLFVPPFGFPEPIYVINEKGTGGRFDNNLREIPQLLCLFKIEDL